MQLVCNINLQVCRRNHGVGLSSSDTMRKKGIPALQNTGNRIFLMRIQDYFGSHTGKCEIGSVIFPDTCVVIDLIVLPAKPFSALRLPEHPFLKFPFDDALRLPEHPFLKFPFDDALLIPRSRSSPLIHFVRVIRLLIPDSGYFLIQ